MSKHRSRKKHRNIETTNKRNAYNPTLVSSFFTTILPFIEKLEKEDKLLLVLPSTHTTNATEESEQSRRQDDAMGIVISPELALDINASYIATMIANVKACGSLEAYFDFRARNPKWAAKHNPDQLLLNICRASRLVISYRYGLAIGNAEYLANDGSSGSPTDENEIYETSENQNSASHPLPSLDDRPLFITMMSDDLQPQSVGYELAGEIILEEYKASM